MITAIFTTINHIHTRIHIHILLSLLVVDMKMEAAITLVMAKKLCKILRMAFSMIQKGVTKSKILLDLDLVMKRGKILGRVLNDVVCHHYSALTCRSHDMDASFISPREYEFSCSNSPAFQPYIPFHVSGRRYGGCRYLYSGQDRQRAAGLDSCHDEYDAAALASEVAEESPLVRPVRRRVRVTDSPFPVGDDDVDCHVDKEAEEFIQRFYKQLWLQKSKAANNHYG